MFSVAIYTTPQYQFFRTTLRIYQLQTLRGSYNDDDKIIDAVYRGYALRVRRKVIKALHALCMYDKNVQATGNAPASIKIHLIPTCSVFMVNWRQA